MEIDVKMHFMPVSLPFWGWQDRSCLIYQSVMVQRGHPLWGGYAAGLAAEGISKPKGGVDVVRDKGRKGI